MRTISRAVLFVNTSKPKAEATAAEIVTFLESHNVETAVYGSLSCYENGCSEEADLAISLGGDGTVLATARFAAPRGIPIFPINLGNFGFITEVGNDDWQDDLMRYLKTGLVISERLMLRVEIIRDGNSVYQDTALNDVVVSGAGISKLIRLMVHLKDAELGQYRADGMIIASPTGSTAYSAAAGGPILNPEMDAMILNPICPFTLSHRPIVLPAWEQIKIRIEEQQRATVLMTVDGQVTFPLREGDEILVSTNEARALIAYSNKRNFYDVLRTKLNWSGGPDA